MDAEGTAKGEGDRARVVYVNVNTMNEKPGMTFSEAYSAKVVTVIILNAKIFITFTVVFIITLILIMVIIKKVAAVLGAVHIICGLTALAANTIGIM